MNKQFIAVIITFLLVSVILSGCLSDDMNSEDSLEDNQNELPPYQEDGIYTCIDHDNVSTLSGSSWRDKDGSYTRREC